MELIKNLYLYSLYRYQILDYDVNKYFAYILRKYKKILQGKAKGKITYTLKAKLFILFTILTQIVISILFININLFLVVIIPILILLTPFFIILTSILLFPIEFFGKKFIIKVAVSKVSSLKNVKIIIVTGAYGKTSTTSFLATLLKGNFKVFTPAFGVNTLLGICNSIYKDLEEKTDILLLEVGAYKRGEVAEIVKLFPPDICIITSSGTQHLEKFGNKEDILLTDFESIDYSKSSSTVIVPSELKSSPLLPIYRDKKYIEVNPVISHIKDLQTYFTINGNEYHTSILGKHLVNNLSLAIKCAMELEIEDCDITSKLTLIKPVKRRMYPYILDNTLYIDDTYNIGFESAKAAIELLKELKKNDKYKRIIVCTGGIVELGKLSVEFNKKYGNILENEVDIIVVFNTPYKELVEEGIHTKSKIVNLEDLKEWNEVKSKIVKEKDIVLLQNDIADQYFI